MSDKKKTLSIKDLVLDLQEREMVDVDGQPIFVGHVSASKLRSSTPSDVQPRDFGVELVKDLSFHSMAGDDALSAEEFEALTNDQLQLLAKEIARRSGFSQKSSDQVEGLGLAALESLRQLSAMPGPLVSESVISSIARQMSDMEAMNARLQGLTSPGMAALARAAAIGASGSSAALAKSFSEANPQLASTKAAVDALKDSPLERLQRAASISALGTLPNGLEHIMEAGKSPLRSKLDELVPDYLKKPPEAKLKFIERDPIRLPEIDWNNTPQARAAEASEESAQLLSEVARSVAYMGDRLTDLTQSIVREALPRWATEMDTQREASRKSSAQATRGLWIAAGSMIITAVLSLFAMVSDKGEFLAMEQAALLKEQAALLEQQIVELRDGNTRMQLMLDEQRTQGDALRDLLEKSREPVGPVSLPESTVAPAESLTP